MPRRLSAAFLVSLALAALVAAATVAGGGERRVPVAGAAGGAATTLQSAHSEPALTPAKRQSGEHVSFVVVAVLAILAGLAATGTPARTPPEQPQGLRAAWRRTVRPRGPPALLFTS